MIDKNKIKRVFELYEYICLEEKEDYIVYAVGRNLYPGVEIVCFDDVDDAKIESFTALFAKKSPDAPNGTPWVLCRKNGKV